MTIIMSGGYPNLSHQQILEVIKNKFIDSWTETNPPVNSLVEFDNIHFNTDWYDGAWEFEVSVVHNTSLRGYAALGNDASEYSMFVDVHVFVKQLTEEHPLIAINIEKEIMRILLTNVTSFGNGISVVMPTEFISLPEEDNTSTIWHSSIGVQVIFLKFDI